MLKSRRHHTQECSCSDMTMVKLLLSVCVVVFSFTPARFQDLCQPASYTVLSEPPTRSWKHVPKIFDPTNAFCDNSLTPGWYRLKVDNRDVDLATSAPKQGACNTGFPIWMKGVVSVAVGKESAITGCIMLSESNTCVFELQLKVVNCGQYRLYHLQRTTSCPSAYCFDLNAQCPPGTFSATGTWPNCFVIEPEVVPFLGTSEENAEYEDLRFQCRFAPPVPNYFYDVVWRINGKEVTRVIGQSAANLPKATQLLEAQWKHQYRLCMNVQCSVRVRMSERGEPSEEYQSKDFFAGMRVLNPAEKLLDGGNTIIRYQSTVPVPCLKSLPPGLCSVYFMSKRTDVNNGCKQTHDGNCGFVLTPSNLMAVHELKVTADHDGLYGDRMSELILHSTPPFSLPGAPKNVWHDSTTKPVIMKIQDTDAKNAGSICVVQDDPHFVSFDGRPFDMHEEGEFVLYRHKTLPLEVRGFFQPCGQARCVCGVAVRSGQQIFVWSKCKDNQQFQTTNVRVYNCNKRQMRVTTPDKGRHYKVELPTGMVVEINTQITSVSITPSPLDINQTTGLCGNFNGNKEDEFIDPQGIRHSNDCDFKFLNIFCVVNKYGMNWRIEKQEESYYGYPDIELEPGKDFRCSCPAGGQPSQDLTCENVSPPKCGTNDPDVTDGLCAPLPPSATGRRKRQAEGNEGLNDYDVRPVFPRYTETQFKLPTWRNGWNPTKASDHCLRVFKQSPAFQPCSKVRNLKMDTQIDFCVLDILLSGTTEWTIGALETFKDSCISEVGRNTTLWVATNNEPSVSDQVKAGICPRECSSRGVCVQGLCQCEAEWIGDDCSFELNTPPTLLGLPRGGVCDLRNRKCDQALVFGTEFARSDSLTCKFVLVYGGNRTHVEATRPYFSKASLRSSGEVVCSVPQDAVRNDTNKPIGYHISVSNNKIVYSEPKLFLPFHSDDFTCVVTGLNFKCSDARKNDITAFVLTPPNSAHVYLLCSKDNSVRLFLLLDNIATNFDGFCSRAHQLALDGTITEVVTGEVPAISIIAERDQYTVSSVAY